MKNSEIINTSFNKKSDVKIRTFALGKCLRKDSRRQLCEDNLKIDVIETFNGTEIWLYIDSTITKYYVDYVGFIGLTGCEIRDIAIKQIDSWIKYFSHNLDNLHISHNLHELYYGKDFDINDIPPDDIDDVV